MTPTVTGSTNKNTENSDIAQNKFRTETSFIEFNY